MHPAYSVILFTTSSGAGYGLLFWLSLGHTFGAFDGARWFSFIALAIALSLITVGLLASTFHLGHPERAHRAFSQWRSSWLSREGVAAVATYVPAGLLGLIWLFGLDAGALVPVLALLAAIGAAVTVYCTGMIYASLRTIRQWNMALVPWIYMALAAATGALLLGVIASLGGLFSGWMGIVGLASIVAAATMKWVYWKQVDGNEGKYTAEMALGLPGLKSVKPLDPPHTKPNFVMREMGYSVARKHADKLRLVTLVVLFVMPLLFVFFALLTGFSAVWFVLATIAAGIGVVTERWLFFAEATHVSMLYYGAQRA
ncbi:MAG: DmsC/YnfH family molybdoenzyme membrane anchor subunit [Ahrensia sp.]